MASYINRRKKDRTIDVIDTMGIDGMFNQRLPPKKLNKKRKNFSNKEYGNIFYEVKYGEDDYEYYDKEFGLGKLLGIYFHNKNSIGEM